MILQPHHTNDLLYRSQQMMREQQRQVLQEAHSDTCNTRSKAVLNIITYGFILRNELINDNMSEALEMLKKRASLIQTGDKETSQALRTRPQSIRGRRRNPVCYRCP